jgi:outer membrane protein assembly factor BamD (BamD/ComL family)
MKRLILFAVAALLASGCSNQKKPSDPILKIGSKTLTKDDFEGYRKAMRYYPSKLSDYFPDNGSEITRLIEIEVLSSKASQIKSKIMSSKDWEWKQKFFPAQMYLIDYLPKTLDFTEQELKAYYNQNTGKFKTTVKVDTTGRDSSYVMAFEDVKSQIVDDMFYAKYPPDSAFLSRFSQVPNDTATIKNEWIYSIRSRIPEYFMKHFYEKDYGKPYPDSISEVYGDGKIITPQDFDVILSWIPESRRKPYMNPQGNKELVEWLLKWKLFSKRAEAAGVTSEPFFHNVMDWALKICVVDSYMGTEVGNVIPKEFPVDSEMIRFAVYDDAYSVTESASPEDIASKIAEFQKTCQTIFYDSMMYTLRSKSKVTFLQSDFRDERDQDPVALQHKADSLRDTGAVDQAQNLYQTLSEDFLFCKEGRNALVELAKLQTEKQSYVQAILNYRKYLLLTSDDEKRCNTFFMIGFIYDEHLNKPEKAERNYKWILKNARSCELADDAEFMVLHLDEPMSSVEELRAEALRQGRKIESFEDDVATQNDTSAVN